VSPTASQWRELARTTTDGVEAALLWNESCNRVKVAVNDDRLCHHLEFELTDENALRAFNRPFVDVATQVALANAASGAAEKGAIV
jgi:hypothetical protein